MLGLTALRDMPLHGEKQVFWAVQEQGDPSTRQALPEWIASPISLQLLRWADTAYKWREKISKRPNGVLPPAMNKKYQAWMENNQEKKLIFRKSQKCVLQHVSDPAEVKRIRSDLFLLTLLPNADTSKLQVVAGNGEARQLVAARGEPCVDLEAPAFLSAQPFDLEEAEIVALEAEEAEENQIDPEANAAAEEQEELLRQELQACDDAQVCDDPLDLDPMDILAVTEDEDELKGAPAHRKVKSFMNRESYKRLHRKGLADLPTSIPGVCLGRHATHNQWQGFFPGISTGLSFSWGGTTGRSEIEALVKTLKGLLAAFIDRFPREQIWKLVNFKGVSLLTDLLCVFLGRHSMCACLHVAQPRVRQLERLKDAEINLESL